MYILAELTISPEAGFLIGSIHTAFKLKFRKVLSEQIVKALAIKTAKCNESSNPVGIKCI